MKTYKIGVAGLHHDHVWGNLEELVRSGRAEIIAAADHYPELQKKFKGLYDAPVYGDYDMLFAHKELDAVYVFADNKLSEKLCIKACENRFHCLVEKPMAATFTGAEAMLDAAKKNHVRLMINWPFVWWPQLRHAVHLAVSGEIGKIWQVKYRAAHQGPVELGCSEPFCEWLYDEERNGAGALMDYCCYGAVLAEVLLGRPDSVTGIKIQTGLKPDLTLEDNAILVLKYPDAIATTEASWTQIGKLSAYGTFIYGSEGTLVVDPDYGGKLIKATRDIPEGEEIAVPESTPDMNTASQHFLAAVEDPDYRISPLCEAENSLGAQWILEEGIRSARA